MNINIVSLDVLLCSVSIVHVIMDVVESTDCFKNPAMTSTSEQEEME